MLRRLGFVLLTFTTITVAAALVVSPKLAETNDGVTAQNEWDGLKRVTRVAFNAVNVNQVLSDKPSELMASISRLADRASDWGKTESTDDTSHKRREVSGANSVEAVLTSIAQDCPPSTNLAWHQVETTPVVETASTFVSAAAPYETHQVVWHQPAVVPAAPVYVHHAPMYQAPAPIHHAPAHQAAPAPAIANHYVASAASCST